MTVAVEQRLIDLAKAFAENRKQLLENSNAIRQVHSDADGYIDMTPLRDRFYSGEWLDEQAVVRWSGWLHAVEMIYAHDDKVLDEDDAFRTMAILLDERKDIKQRANALKSRLRAIGDKLLRATP